MKKVREVEAKRNQGIISSDIVLIVILIITEII